jgi:hypothetical protein
VGSFREFAIEPPSEAICVPEPHTWARVCIPFRNGSVGWLECAGGSLNVGSFREFAIEPPSEAICVPKPHTSGGVALDLIATHRSQSLFVAVTKHEPRKGASRGGMRLLTTVPSAATAVHSRGKLLLPYPARGW